MMLAKYFRRYIRNIFGAGNRRQREYLTVKQAAQETDLTEERIKELIKLKEIPAAKKVGKWYIKREDLTEFMSWNIWFYPLSRVIAKADSIKKYSESLQNKSQLKEDSTIYINIPFCKSFCTFCPYLKHLFNKDKIRDYLQALKREMSLYSKTKYVKSKIFSIVYFGGGTPSCLSSKQLVELLNCCKDSFHISKDANITVEGTPATFSAPKMEALYKNGVERLSFGVQTFNDELGKLLNLSHDSERVFKILKIARYIGYKHLDIDLLFNLPGQTMADHLADLKRAIELRLDSVTSYLLGLSPKTKLYRQLKSGEIPMINLSSSHFLRTKVAAHRLLIRAGYEQFAPWYYVLRKSYGQKQNPVWWRGYGENILGLGAAAMGFLNNYSYENAESLSEYIRKIDNNIPSVRSIIHLSREERMHRVFVLGLSLRGKVDKREFLQEFKIDPEIYFSDIINRLKNRKMIQVSDSEISLSFVGKLYWADVCSKFF